MRPREFAEEFEALVADLLRAHDFEVERHPRRDGSFRRPDLLLTYRGATTVAEVKFFRARQVDVGQLIAAAEQADTGRAEFAADHGLLIVTCRVDELARARLRRFPKVEILDYDAIGQLLAGHPRLAERFASLVRKASMFGNGEDDAVRGPAASGETLSRIKAPPPEPVAEFIQEIPAEPRELRGAQLCKELRVIRPAPAGSSREERLKQATAFEEKCVECLLYLFRENLAGDEAQFTTDKGLSRFDFLARLRPVGEFWRLLVTDFHARYIVFEFKLHSRKIKQGEILTTEKYLYRQALRPVAIIISLEGPDKNARETARGALREHGKLILNLTVAQVCAMLHAKNGEHPDGTEVGEVEDPLFEVLDDMLMKIER